MHPTYTDDKDSDSNNRSDLYCATYPKRSEAHSTFSNRGISYAISQRKIKNLQGEIYKNVFQR